MWSGKVDVIDRWRFHTHLGLRLDVAQVSTAHFSPQHVAQFIAAVSAAETEAAAARASVERAAETLDADVAAIVCGGDLMAAVGFAEGRAPIDELERVRPGAAGARLEVAGVGAWPAAAAALEHPPGGTFVVARTHPLTQAETALLGAMARVASIAMRMFSIADRERAAREELERLGGEQVALRRVADKQAALRRVATLVARGEPPGALFAAVAEEVGRVVPAADVALVGRYHAAGVVEFVGGWSRDANASVVGERVTLGGNDVLTLVVERNEPARVDRVTGDDRPETALGHRWARSSAGAPISAEGRLWGVMTVGSLQPHGLPDGIENQLADFTDLVATAIGNAHAREELGMLADEQAALRRVAILIARGEPPAAAFAAVAEELGRLFGAEATGCQPVRARRRRHVGWLLEQRRPGRARRKPVRPRRPQRDHARVRDRTGRASRPLRP